MCHPLPHRPASPACLQGAQSRPLRRAALPLKVQSVHETIRSCLGDEGAKTRIIYGGSLNSENSAAMFAEKDIDGGLVGGASLKAEDFLRIIKMAERL